MMPPIGEKNQQLRHRGTSRCCGLYTPMGLSNDALPRSITDVGDESASATEMTIQEARGVSRAFASYTHIHGMKNVYQAQGN